MMHVECDFKDHILQAFNTLSNVCSHLLFNWPIIPTWQNTPRHT